MRKQIKEPAPVPKAPAKQAKVTQRARRNFIERHLEAGTEHGAVPLFGPAAFEAAAEQAIAESLSRVREATRRLRHAGLNEQAFRNTEQGPRDGGTEQTRRKLKADVVARLFRQGKIARGHQQAADEIEELQHALLASLLPSKWPREKRIFRTTGPRDYRDPISRLSPRRLRIFQEHYAPWVHWLQAEPVRIAMPAAGGIRIVGYRNPLPLVTDIVVDNRALREVEERYELPAGKGHAALVLRMSLGRYCQIAGWQRQSEEPPA